MTEIHHQHVHGHHGDGPTDAGTDEASWDERYRSSPKLWSGNPNAQLVSEASDLTPGTALDAGCGEGADAIWLAERGWRVTAVDISSVALARGEARAKKLGAEIDGRITWVHGDLTRWEPPASYDLVTAQFIHVPRDLREPLYRRLAESVAPGGTLLIVGHHPSDMETTVPRPRARELFFTGDEIAETLDPNDWEIIASAERERTGTDPDGNSVPIHDAVLRAYRK